jgi:hypothetical protein
MGLKGWRNGRVILALSSTIGGFRNGSDCSIGTASAAATLPRW